MQSVLINGSRTLLLQRPLVAPVWRASHRSLSTRSSSANIASSSSISSSTPSWEIRMLYDGECSLCMKEVNFLRERDAGKDKIDFVDIASPSYRADDNYGITYEQAMEKIHAIERDGRIITGVEVFRRLYEAVGLGFVYAITKNPSIEKAANAVYDVWAKYRTQITGREALGVILQRRAAETAGRGDAGSLCSEDPVTGAMACEVPAAAEKVTSSTSK